MTDTNLSYHCHFVMHLNDHNLMLSGDRESSSLSLFRSTFPMKKISDEKMSEYESITTWVRKFRKNEVYLSKLH